MDAGLLEPAVVLIDILIVAIPRLLLKHFSNSDIPTNFEDFDKHYKEDIRKIEEHSIGELYKKFEEAVNSKIIEDEKDKDEKDRDKDFIKQLYTHEVFFVELGFHNIKSYKYGKIKWFYCSIKHYRDNFDRFYYVAITIVIITSIGFVLFNLDTFILIIIFVIVFFLLIESIRNLYYLGAIQRKIDKMIESIQEDIKHIPKHLLH